MLEAILLLTSLSGLAAEEPQDIRYYVALTGSDEGPGTEERPFKTIDRARDEVRKRVAAGLGANVTVFLREGTYELDEPLVFGPEDSGTEAFSVTYAAYPGETPVLSGGRKIKDWKRGEAKIWTAQVPSVKGQRWNFRQLFVNGKRRQRARTPTAGFFLIDGPSSQDKPFRLKYRHEDVKKSWASSGEVEVVAMLAWAEIRMQLRSLDEENHVAILSGDPRPSNQEANARYYVENAPDGLDAAGEWRLDTKTGIVSYWPMPDEDMPNAEVQAPLLRELVLIQGDPLKLKFVRNLKLQGLTFCHTDWTLEENGYADTQASVAIGGALKATGALDCAVEKCTFTRLAGYGVEFAGGCKRNRIVGNKIFDVGAGGVRIGEGFQRPNEEEKTSENIVSDNHIHDGGLVYHAAVGVWVGQSSKNIVANNEISDLYYTGISVGWTWGYGPNQCKENKLEANHIHRLGKDMLSDMGGIYTLGVQPGTTIRNNLIHDVSAYTYGGWGIYPDEGSSEILIENNVVYRCKSAGFHHHYGRENIVRNNIFALNKEFELMRTRAEEHRSFTFENNIVYWSEGQLLGSNWTGDNYRFDKNVYWFTGGSGFKFAEWTFEDWKKKGQDQNSEIADPLFAHPTFIDPISTDRISADPQKFDFTLKPESPALKMGFRQIDMGEVGPRPEYREKKGP